MERRKCVQIDRLDDSRMQNVNLHSYSDVKRTVHLFVYRLLLLFVIKKKPSNDKFGKFQIFFTLLHYLYVVKPVAYFNDFLTIRKQRQCCMECLQKSAVSNKKKTIHCQP